MERRIIHVDMDAFFASVEQNDDKSLKGKPVIVGGARERGVVCTCSYEARKYGVRSAMPGFMAKKLCPNGIFTEVRMERYQEISREIFSILHKYSDKIEKVSVDEAYLDITNSKECSIEIADKIKKEVKTTTGLTISVGISYNKFLAKLASDWNKPDGIMIIKKEMIPEILLPLNISKVHGLGKKSVKKLNGIGIFTVEELLKVEKEFLEFYFGKMGLEIYDRIRGIDNREVTSNSDRKSVGRETTLKRDTRNKTLLKSYIKEFSKEIEEYLKDRDLYIKTITVKTKDARHKSHTKSHSLENVTNDFDKIYETAAKAIDNMNFEESIRLIGVSVSNFDIPKTIQLNLFEILK